MPCGCNIVCRFCELCRSTEETTLYKASYPRYVRLWKFDHHEYSKRAISAAEIL